MGQSQWLKYDTVLTHDYRATWFQVARLLTVYFSGQDAAIDKHETLAQN